MTTCTKCGHPLREGVNFCGKCGASQAPSPMCKICGVEPVAGVSGICPACQSLAARAQCPSCGAERKPGKRFCQRCGAALDQAGPGPAIPSKPAIPQPVPLMESVRTEPLAMAPAVPPKSALARRINEVHETPVEMVPPAARATQPEPPADRQPRDFPPSSSALNPGNNSNRFRGRTLVLIVAAVASIFIVTGAVLYTLGSTVNLQSNMPEATVALDGRTVGQTAPDGTLSFSRVRLGKHVITVNKPNLGEASGNVSVTLLSRMVSVKVQAPPVVSDLHPSSPSPISQNSTQGGNNSEAASAVTRIVLLDQLPSWVPVRNVPPQNYPPRPYREDGACPGEGCSYGGRWQAKREVLLYTDIGSSQLVGQVAPGEIVNVPTGAVVTLHPGVWRIKRAVQVHGVGIEMGDLLYALTDHGEGTYTVCYRGQLIKWNLDRDIVNLESSGDVEHLTTPVFEWWARVAKTTGRAGWTKDVQAFTGESRYEESPSATQVSPSAPADVETNRTTRMPKTTGANSGPGAAQVMEQAKSLFSARRYTEALQACERVLRSDPQNNSARQLKRQIEDTMRVLGVQ